VSLARPFLAPLGVCLIQVLAACSAEPSRARPTAEDAARIADAEVVRPRTDASYAGLNIESATVGMVRVPSGAFLISCDRKVDPACDWSSLVEDKLPEFYIDKTEVTVAAYRRCVEAGKCTAPTTGKFCGEEQLNWAKSDRDDHPINCVTIEQAGQYCAHLGRHLPTKPQWEKAARGTDGRTYPWGFDKPTCALAVIQASDDDDSPTGCGRNSTWPVGSRPAGASPYDALDMVGNVSEIVTLPTPPDGPVDPTDERELFLRDGGSKGGGYDTSPGSSGLRTWQHASGVAAQLGFRCALQPSYQRPR
jgi:formylglycine-generating enzyme required for sulfatase activity